MFYDALHLLVEAYLIFDKVKSNNHECLFAYLCMKHPSLELDWDFFERVRVRRNGIFYDSRPIKKEELDEDLLGFQIYISLFKKEIINLLKEQE